MFIHITPKKVNKASDLKIYAVFEHQGVAYEERYKTKAHFLAGVRKKKDKFVSAVDFNLYKCIYPDTLKEYSCI